MVVASCLNMCKLQPHRSGAIKIARSGLRCNSTCPCRVPLRRSITVFPAPKDSYDLSGFHHRYESGRHTDSSIQSDHSWKWLSLQPWKTLKLHLKETTTFCSVKLTKNMKAQPWSLLYPAPLEWVMTMQTIGEVNKLFEDIAVFVSTGLWVSGLQRVEIRSWIAWVFAKLINQ